MNRLLHYTLFLICVLTLVHHDEAASPFFLQAITSALGTIPFTAGPMTTGLVGAKLAVGSKLLYYLGLFGRRRSRPKPAPVSPVSNMGFGSGVPFSSGMQQFPGGFGGGGFQQFGGFGGQPNFFGQYPYGYDPAQLFQMLAAQGIDPFSGMQGAAQGIDPFSGMQGPNFGGGAGGQAIPSSQFPFPTGATTQHRPPSGGGQGKPPIPASHVPVESQGEDSGDIESFFTFLRDMDENTCISRLMCDIGANPSFLGEFSENIHGIISSLEVQPSSGAFQYISIMETGRRDGNCNKRFPQCGDASYEVVKNVAPSVGMPQNINSDSVNKL